MGNARDQTMRPLERRGREGWVPCGSFAFCTNSGICSASRLAHGINSCLSPAAPNTPWNRACVRRSAPSPGLSFRGPGAAGPRTFSRSVYCVLSWKPAPWWESQTPSPLCLLWSLHREHTRKSRRDRAERSVPLVPHPRPALANGRAAAPGPPLAKPQATRLLLVRPQALFSPTPPSGTPPYTCFRTSRAPPPGLRQFLRVPLFWTTSTVLRSGVLPGAGTPGLSVWGHGRAGALACGRQLAEMGVLSVTHAEGKRRLSRGSAPPPRPRSPGRGHLSWLPTAATSLHPCCPLQASRRQSPHPRGLSLPPLLGILLLGQTVSSPHYLFCFYLHRCLWATVQCRGAYSAASATGSTFQAAPASPGRAPPSGVRHFLAAWRRPAGFCFRRLFACASSKNNHPFLWRTLSFPL